MSSTNPPLPRVVEVMTKPVVSIDPGLRINVAIELMRANQVRRLPVLNKTGRLVGIVTLANALLAESENSGSDQDVPFVRDVMTDYVYTIGPDATVDQAADMMVNHCISALPVMDGTEMIGLVTESDLFEFLAGWLRPKASAA